jgi:hypothetical protein
MATEKIAVALRVLTAINNRRHPDPNDVVLLRAYCPEGRDLDPDELACMAIQQEREHREREQAQTA